MITLDSLDRLIFFIRLVKVNKDGTLENNVKYNNIVKVYQNCEVSAYPYYSGILDIF